MSILTQSGSLPHPRRKLEEIGAILRAARAVTRQCLERSIQGLLNRWVGEGLVQASPPWCCSRCGNRESGAFRRNGSYSGRLSTLAGVITLHVPRLRCLCGAHVSLRFPILEPRRGHWWDVWLQVIEGLGERVSVWPATGGCDRLQRRGVYLSRSTVVRWLARLRLPPLGPIPGVTNEIQVDSLYGHLWGPLPRRWRDHTYALLIAANRDPRCPEKVLGAVLAAEEEREAYRSLGDLLLGRGLQPEAPLSITADGASAIKAGLGVSFPKAQVVRCLWHLSRLVADLGPADLRSALRRDCRHVLRAPTWDEALDRYERFRDSWPERAPDSCRALAEGFEEAMAPVVPEGPKVRQRTNGLAERIAREFRRFLRPRQALRSSATAPALVALAVAQINARHRREDWLRAFLGAGVGLPQRLTQFRVPLHT